MPEQEADAAAGTKTKRQRLKDADEGKNVWPQFPKLQGTARRDTAHLRAAGLKHNSKPKNDVFTHLGRALGGPDAVTRHTAVLQLEHYLTQRCESTGLSELDLLKLSKCLWYTLYMADKQVVQMELSKIIAKLVVDILAGTKEEDEYAAALYLRACEAEEADMLEELDEDEDLDEEDFPIEEVDSDEEDVDFEAKQMELLQEEEESAEEEEEEEEASEDEEEHSEEEHLHDEHCDHDSDNIDEDSDDTDPMNTPHGRGAHLSALFVRTFLRTILSNWAQMDKYRIDKFYTMLRFILERIYAYCASRGWNMGMIRLFNDGLCDEVLAKLPNGVRCHLIDVCLDELVKHEEDVTEAVFLDVVQPFFAMAQSGVEGDDLVHTRSIENVLERFLDKYSVFSEQADGDDDAPRFHQVHVGTVAQFIFEMASDDETLQRYRSRLYDVYKKYMKRIHQVGEDNDVDISRVDLSIDDEDEEGDQAEAAGDDIDDESNPVVEVLDSESKKEASKPEDESKTNVSSKKKKKKKRKKEKDAVQESKDTGGDWKEQIETQIKSQVQDMETENDIVISIADQRKAKDAMKKETKNPATKKRQRDDPKHENVSDSEKRVKFGEKNFAKSHKASMKALRQASPPAGVRPDRGILLNKDAKIALRKPKKGKKNRK